MKRILAMVLALLMVFALIPVLGENAAQAAVSIGITITKQPDKQFYFSGEGFDPTGMELEYYVLDNGVYQHKEVISPLDANLQFTNGLNGPTMAKDGSYKLTGGSDFTMYAVYTNSTGTICRAAFTLRCRLEMARSPLAVVTPPNVTRYFVGEKLDLSGLKYGLSIWSSATSPASIIRTDPLTLEQLTLRENDASGDLITPTSPPTLSTSIKIWARYVIPEQFEYKNIDSDAVLITVLASPTSVLITAPTPVPPNPDFTTADVGTTQTLALTTTGPDAPYVNTDFSWGSSNQSVATVDSKGQLKILGLGETTISVRSRGDNQVSDEYVLKVVNPIALTGVKLNKTEVTMTTGNSDKLIATLIPADAGYDTITWASDAPTIVSVTPDSDTHFATIKGLKAGTATITVTAKSGANTFTAICLVKVNDVPVDQLYLTPTTLTLREGESYQIIGTILPDYATNQNLTWSSADPALATVKDGRVSIKKLTDAQWTALGFTAAQIAAGTCTTSVKIMCVAESNPMTAKAECVITIKQGVLATQVSLNKYGASVAIGGISQLIATVLPTNATNRSVTWVSSDPTIATVSDTGKITGLKAGQCTVKAISNGSGDADISATCVVTVSSISTGSIGLSALNLTMYKGQTQTLVATVFPSNATNKDVMFTSTNPGVVSVNPTTGVVTALGNGKATIVVTANDGSSATASCMVSVINKVDVTGITLNMSDFALMYLDTTVLTATVVPDYASEIEVNWTSSAPSVVSVDQNGKVSGLMAGQSAVITAAAKDGSGVSASCTVSVVNTFYGNGKVVNCLKRVNVRAQPSGSATWVGFAYLNGTFKVVGKTGSWYKIIYEGKTAYIWTAYIRLLGDGTADYTSAGKTTPAPATDGGTGTGTGTATKAVIINCVYAVNVRKGPGTNYDKIGIAPLSAEYKYLGTYGDWYKVQFNTTTEGYIHMNYVTIS